MNRAQVGFASSIFIMALIFAACSSAPKKQAQAKPAAAKAATADAKKADVKKADAAKATAEEPSKPIVTCVYGSTKREISIVTKDSGCTVNYSKDGNASEIATGSAGSTKCSDVQKTVRGNLEKAGYTCQ